MSLGLPAGAAIVVLVPVAVGIYAVSRGRDANWDLQNYHWYDVPAGHRAEW